jgi:hypothetical protein
MNPIRKGLAVAVIVLLVGMSVTSTGRLMSDDDTTPPVTTHKFDPPFPNGDNDWYISDLEITLTATDDSSGVNATYYRINNIEWREYIEPVIISDDGYCFFEYYSIDNAGNEEDVHSFTIKIDQTKPKLRCYYWLYKEDRKWHVKYTAICNDSTSGIDRVGLYINNGLVSEDNEEPYEWTFEWSDIFEYVIVKLVSFNKAGNSEYDDINYYYDMAPKREITGFIRNLEVNDQNITFFAILILKALHYGGSPFVEYKLHFLKQLTIPRDSVGYFGKHFIRIVYFDW